jgi:hypothetical protein
MCLGILTQIYLTLADLSPVIKQNNCIFLLVSCERRKICLLKKIRAFNYWRNLPKYIHVLLKEFFWYNYVFLLEIFYGQITFYGHDGHK